MSVFDLGKSLAHLNFAGEGNPSSFAAITKVQGTSNKKVLFIENIFLPLCYNSIRDLRPRLRTSGAMMQYIID